MLTEGTLSLERGGCCGWCCGQDNSHHRCFTPSFRRAEAAWEEGTYGSSSPFSPSHASKSLSSCQTGSPKWFYSLIRELSEVSQEISPAWDGACPICPYQVRRPDEGTALRVLSLSQTFQLSCSCLCPLTHEVQSLLKPQGPSKVSPSASSRRGTL